MVLKSRKLLIFKLTSHW